MHMCKEADVAPVANSSGAALGETLTSMYQLQLYCGCPQPHVRKFRFDSTECEREGRYQMCKQTLKSEVKQRGHRRQ